jgi:excisionase family DNA binding protein
MEDKNSTLTVQKRYLNTAELSEYLCKSKWWIYDKIRQRGIPFTPVGRELLFDLRAIDTWLAKKSVKSI